MKKREFSTVFWSSDHLIERIDSNVQAAERVFKNCSELNKVYPGGVALPGAVNSGGTSKKEPKYNKSLYIANKKSDRDKDGIACER